MKLEKFRKELEKEKIQDALQQWDATNLQEEKAVQQKISEAAREFSEGSKLTVSRSASRSQEVDDYLQVVGLDHVERPSEKTKLPLFKVRANKGGVP